ncbi:MAG: GIY-YIG nuclease family protein, partial [Acidobacteriota bacterium]|nr:GIY-YIG nuclease family protein [Acidobacteriota bacterium]
WYLYLIRTRDGALYTGIATDVERRLAEHEQGTGSKYLRSRGPLELVYRARIGARALALQVEARIKKLPKRDKEALVMTGVERERLLALLAMPPAHPLHNDAQSEDNSREE